MWEGAGRGVGDNHEPGASWLVKNEAECWCVYCPNTPAVSAERDAGS